MVQSPRLVEIPRIMYSDLTTGLSNLVKDHDGYDRQGGVTVTAILNRKNVLLDSVLKTQL